MSTPEQRESARRRKQNQRDRDLGLPESYPHEPRVTKEDIEAAQGQHEANLVWAQTQDASGSFYKSECHSCVELLGVYEGSIDLSLDSREESELNKNEKKKKKDKESRLNPSLKKITIPAIVDPSTGEKFEPLAWDGEKVNLPKDRERRKIFEVNEVVSFQRWLDLRDKSRKNLFWFGRLLGKGLFHSVHQIMCDNFVKKDFDGMYFPGYNLDDFHQMLRIQKRTVSEIDETPCRLMIMLEARKAYKSTIDGIDAAQWIINCPDIRILIITGIKVRANKFAHEIKGYFHLARRGEPTAFQLLFPEFVLTGLDGTSEQPVTFSARTFNQKEDTLWVTSIESSNTGDHCDILKADDVVTAQNSADEEMRAELKFEFDSLIADVCDSWGFIDVAGTRYFTDDWYGTRAKPNEKTGEVSPFRYSCRGSWILSPEHLLDYANGKLSIKEILYSELGTLVFPYNLSWKALRGIYNDKDERNFKNQQLNEATDPSEDNRFVNEFREDQLIKHFHPPEFKNGLIGTVVQVWDTAYSERKTSDFSVGITALIYPDQTGVKDCILVLDATYGKWNSSELTSQVLNLYRANRSVELIHIEKTNGSEHLLEAIGHLAGKFNVLDIVNKIRLIPPDLQDHAKRNRVKSLQLILADGRLDFINGPYLDEMMKQLLSFTGEKSSASRKDDFPDCLSFLLRFLRRSSWDLEADPIELEKEEDLRRKKEAVKALHEMMFSPGSMSPVGKASDYRKQPPPVTEAPPPPDSRRALLNRILPPGMRA